MIMGVAAREGSGQNTMITNKERGQAQRARTERAAASVSSR
jgi:hypothetical protein